MTIDNEDLVRKLMYSENKDKKEKPVSKGIKINESQKVVVIEDLVSTGGSSLG